MNDTTYERNTVTAFHGNNETFTMGIIENCMNNHRDTSDLVASRPHIIVEILEYVPHSILIRTIIKKTTGNITISSLDAGEELTKKTIPFDSFIQIIHGTAEVVINAKKYKLILGEGIIIPAHAAHCFTANEQFKMICTVIKS